MLARTTTYDEGGYAVAAQPADTATPITPATFFKFDVLGRDSLTLMPDRKNLPDEGNGTKVTSKGDTVSH